ncbi:MAG: hypothetical protein QXW40_07535 [Thermofilum sp.]
MPIPPVELYNLRYLTADNVTSYTIAKETGISKKIVDIWADAVPDKTYMDVNIATVRVARIPLKWGDCVFVAEPEGSFNDVSILQFLQKIFPEFAIEADQDEDITLTFNNTIPKLHILYAVDKPGIDKTKLGRSKCPDLLYACPITHSAAINATRNYPLDVALIPTGFPEIKDGFVVPSGREFVLKAIAFGTAAAGSTTPTYLHLWDERFELFTPLTHQGVSVAYGKNLLSADITREDIVKVKDYSIPSGHRITINVDATYDGANAIAANTLALFLIGLWRAVK